MNQNPPTQNNYNSIPGYDLATDIPPLPQENKAPQAGYTNDPNNQFHTFNLPNTPSKKGRSRRKIIATILGILLLVFGMGTGVYLSQRTQDIREKAARQPGKCDDFDYGLCNPDGTCRKKGMCMGCCRGKPSTPAPNSTRPDICSSATVNKKTLKPGETITISSTSKEDVNYFMYAVYNMDNLYGPDNAKPVCVKDGGDITTAQDICPAGSHLLIFEDPNKELRKSGSRTLRYEELFVKDELTGKTVSNLSITAYFQKEGEPISVPKPECVVRTISSQEQGQIECLDVKAYAKEGENWILLNQEDLSSLEPGDKIYLTVTGKAEDPNKFTKAKFKINNSQPIEVPANSNTKEKDSEKVEIFYEYTIPTNTTSFSIKAAIYYEGIGWIGSTE